MKEEFKGITGYENLYHISNLGRVKSFKYNKSRILKNGTQKGGYKWVYLCKDKKRKKFYIHQLVSMMFMNHTPDKLNVVVDHKDEDPTNNKLSNLRLLSHRRNISRGFVNCSSEFTGVYFLLKNNVFISAITIEKRNYKLGSFKKEIDAKNAYDDALFNWEQKQEVPILRKQHSSLKGVSYNILRKRWIAYDYVDKKRIHIGTYDSEKEAIEAKNIHLNQHR